MDRADRIELRRFVGREFLLCLWFETELFDGHIRTEKHGTLPMWVSARLVLSMGREKTTIRGELPGAHREAKEAVLRGKLPEVVGFRLGVGEIPAAFSIRGDSLALSGLSFPEPPKEERPAIEVLEDAPKRRPRRPREDAEEVAAVLEDEVFYERMRQARQVEEILEALYVDFLDARLGPAFGSVVAPAIARWARGEPVDPDAYRRARG